MSNMPGMGEGDSSKSRVMLAFLLSFLILFGYSYFFQKPVAQKPAIETSQPAEEFHLPSPPKEELPQRSVTEALPEAKVVTLETPLMKVSFSSLRGAIKDVLLKKSHMIRDTEVSLVKFQNLDVQPGTLSRMGDLPGKAFLSYHVIEQGSDFVVFESKHKKLTLQKKFSLVNHTSPENYAIQLDIRVLNEGRKPLNFARGFDLAIGSLKVNHPDEELRPDEVTYYIAGGEGAYLKKPVRKIKERFVEDLDVAWAAIKTKYFALVAKPLGHSASALITESVEENFQTYVTAALRIGSFVVEPGQDRKMSFLLYDGPKDYNLLRSLNHHLESLLDFEGIWGHLCRGLVISLQSLNRIFHNYGIAIIILTVLLKLLFYPLSAISMKSMREMQAVKPQLDALRKKYKDNPKKIQQETMAVYKEHNIKPLAGCLPMLVQIPIFIAFYKMLMVSIELRGADFLWIKDLARADTIFRLGSLPINILPILNGATMFWQQRLTPMDPSQKMMKYMMPIMITVFFYGLPSGLILYWLVTTLVTVLQQYQVQKHPLPQAKPVVSKK